MSQFTLKKGCSSPKLSNLTIAEILKNKKLFAYINQTIAEILKKNIICILYKSIYRQLYFIYVSVE